MSNQRAKNEAMRDPELRAMEAIEENPHAAADEFIRYVLETGYLFEDLLDRVAMHDDDATLEKAAKRFYSQFSYLPTEDGLLSHLDDPDNDIASAMEYAEVNDRVILLTSLFYKSTVGKEVVDLIEDKLGEWPETLEFFGSRIREADSGVLHGEV